MKVTVSANVCDRCKAKALRQDDGVCIWFKGQRLMSGCSAHVVVRHDGQKHILHLCALCTAEGMQVPG